MQRKRYRRSLLIVALATLALSAAMVASEAHLFQTEDPSIRVGMRRLGDVAAYDGESTYTLSEDGTTTTSRPPTGTFVRRLDGPETIPLVDGTVRNVVFVLHDWYKDGQKVNGYIGGQAFDSTNRQPVRIDQPVVTISNRTVASYVTGYRPPTLPPEAQSKLETQVKNNQTWSRYRNLWDPTDVRLVWAQGQILRVGEKVGEDLGAAMRREWSCQCPSDRVDFEARVTEAAHIDGVPVVALRFEWHRVYWDESVTIYEDWANETVWFRDGSPYHLREEYEYHARWPDARQPEGWADERNQGTDWLVHLTRGTSELAWGPFSHENIPAPKARVGPGTHPSTQGGAFRYGLDEALRSVESDASLVEFTLWKLQNPGWRLTGAQTHPNIGTLMTDQTWNLGFNAPNGATAIGLTTTKDERGAITSQVRGSRQCEQAGSVRFQPAMVGPNFPNIQDVDRLWRNVAPGDLQRDGPNFFSWGTNYCPAKNDRGFQVMYYGRTQVQRVVGSNGPTFAEERHHDIRIQPSSGALLEAYHTQKSLQSTNPVPLQDEAPPALPSRAPSPDPGVAGTLAAAGTGISLLLLLAYAAPFAQQGAVSLYSKLVKNQLLDHELRDELVALIRENPGIEAPQLREITASGWSTIIYHLGVLRENNLVTSVRDGRHRRYFLVGAMHHGQLRRLAILRNPRTRQVNDLIRAQPGIDRPALARMLGVTPAAITWHIKRLQSANLIRDDRQRGVVRFFSLGAEAGITIGPEAAPLRLEA